MKMLKLILLIYGLILIIEQASAAEVAVIPSTQIVTHGESFNLNITIIPLGTAIAGAQLNFAFNQSLFRVNSITEGNLFKQNGASTFFNAGTLNNSAGTVVNIFNAIIGNNSVSTQGTFITINFTSIGITGTSWINLSNVKISNPDGLSVGFNATNGSVMIDNPPVISTIGNKTVNENQTLTFTVSASDTDGDTLTYSASNLPSGATFDPATKTFLWTPNFNQDGTYQNVHFEVSDGTLIDFENIMITVNNVNRPPTFTSTTPANGSRFNETDVIQINATATDLDNDPLSYNIKIDSVQVFSSANYTWVTNYNSSGYHNINISVSDGTAAVNSMIMIYVHVHPRYDVNADGIVDIADLTIIAQHLNQIVIAPYPRYDVNMDGIVDIADLVIAGQHFGEAT